MRSRRRRPRTSMRRRFDARVRSRSTAGTPGARRPTLRPCNAGPLQPEECTSIRKGIRDLRCRTRNRAEQAARCSQTSSAGWSTPIAGSGNTGHRGSPSRRKSYRRPYRTRAPRWNMGPNLPWMGNPFHRRAAAVDSQRPIPAKCLMDTSRASGIPVGCLPRTRTSRSNRSRTPHHVGAGFRDKRSFSRRRDSVRRSRTRLPILQDRSACISSRPDPGGRPWRGSLRLDPWQGR